MEERVGTGVPWGACKSIPVRLTKAIEARGYKLARPISIQRNATTTIRRIRTICVRITTVRSDRTLYFLKTHQVYKDDPNDSRHSAVTCLSEEE